MHQVMYSIIQSQFRPTPTMKQLVLVEMVEAVKPNMSVLRRRTTEKEEEEKQILHKNDNNNNNNY